MSDFIVKASRSIVPCLRLANQKDTLLRRKWTNMFQTKHWHLYIDKGQWNVQRSHFDNNYVRYPFLKLLSCLAYGFLKCNKTGNGRMSHWGALVQSLLQWKSNDYYTTWVCVFAALGIQHAMRMRQIDICGLLRPIIFFHIISYNKKVC